jgi:hypothetical protein
MFSEVTALLKAISSESDEEGDGVEQWLKQNTVKMPIVTITPF